MTPYALRYIPEEDLCIFKMIEHAVMHMPDLDLGEDENKKQITLSCHILARAVGKIFGIRVQDGLFARIYQHSWVITPNECLIDVYPVGIIGGPIMLDGSQSLSPRKILYHPVPTGKLSHGRFSKSSFRRSVRRTMKALLRTIS